MIYSRALSPDEIRSLYLDPYQMFRRSRLDLGLGALEGGPEPAGLSIAVAAHHLNQMRRAS